MSRWLWVLGLYVVLTRTDGSPIYVRADSVTATYAPIFSTHCPPSARAEVMLANGRSLCVRETPKEVVDVVGRS